MHDPLTRCRSAPPAIDRPSISHRPAIYPPSTCHRPAIGVPSTCHSTHPSQATPPTDELAGPPLGAAHAPARSPQVGPARHRSAIDQPSTCHRPTIDLPPTCHRRAIDLPPHLPARPPQDPGRYAIFGSGPRDLPHGIDTILYTADGGSRVDMFDIVNDPRHDLLLPGATAACAARIRAHEWEVVGLAMVCTSWSRVKWPAVRHAQELWGLPDPPAMVGTLTGREYLDYHNALSRAFLALLDACIDASVDFWFENPADATPEYIDGVANRFHDRRAGSAASIFRTREWQHAEARARATMGGAFVLLVQCPLGALGLKPTAFFATGRVAASLAPLAWLRCVCIGPHVGAARGRSRDGISRSWAAQAYPPALNQRVATAMLAATLQRREGARPTPAPAPQHASPQCLDALSDCDTDDDATDDDASTDDDMPSMVEASASESEGAGEIAFGPALHPRVRSAVEEARRAPPRFATHRRLRAASAEQVQQTPVWYHQESRRPAREGRRAGEPHPGAVYPEGLPRGGDPLPRPIHISALFIGDAWERILEWLREAEEQMAVYLAGGTPHLATLVITQAEMHPAARYIIWDTSDPNDCVPCQPSGTDDVEPGPQVHRERLLAAAVELGMEGEDVVRQATGGGIEALSTTSLDTVLAFHHGGVAEHYDATAKAVAADLRAGFVSPPPSPCRPTSRSGSARGTP